MCCPHKLPFFIKNVLLNLTILYVLILFVNTLTSNNLPYTPPYFHPMRGHLLFTIIHVQEAHVPLAFQVLDMIWSWTLPVIPRVKELQSVALTSSRGSCINYRPKDNFHWPRQQLTMSLHYLFYQGNRFFKDCRAFP